MRIPRERLSGGDPDASNRQSDTIIRTGSARARAIFTSCATNMASHALGRIFPTESWRTGSNPTDMDTYLANVREKILRFRKLSFNRHLVCAQRSDFRPKILMMNCASWMAELELPACISQAHQWSWSEFRRAMDSSASSLRSYYNFMIGEAFKTELAARPS